MKRTSSRERIALAALTISACAVAGCRSRESHSGPRVASNEGSAAGVKGFWRAHGDPAAWKRHAAVSFVYSVESLKDADSARFAEVAFRFDDYRHIWARREGEGALERLDLTNPFDWRGSPAIGCALHTLRYLFSVPIASARGRWEFRTLLAPADVQVPRTLEVAPLDITAPVGACKLEEDASTGLLARLTYFPRSRFAEGEPRTVTFTAYADIDGAKIAMKRESVLFREELRGVRFLDGVEADLRLPLSGPETTGARQ